MVPIDAHPAHRVLIREPGVAPGSEPAPAMPAPARSLVVTGGPGEWLLPFVGTWLAKEAASRGLRPLLHEPSPPCLSAAHLLGIRKPGEAWPALSSAIRKREIVMAVDGVRYLYLGAGPSDPLDLADRRVRHVLADGVTRLEASSDLFFMLVPSGATMPSRWIDGIQQVAILASPAPARLMEAYALLKTIWELRPEIQADLIVAGPCLAVEVEAARRFFLRVTERFLGKAPRFLGAIHGESADFDGSRNERGLPLAQRGGGIALAEPSPSARREIARLLDGLLAAEAPPRKLLTALLVESVRAPLERPSAA